MHETSRQSPSHEKTHEKLETFFNRVLTRHAVYYIDYYKDIPEHLKFELIEDDKEIEKIEITNTENKTKTTLIRPSLDVPVDSIYRESDADGKPGLLFTAVIQRSNNGLINMELNSGKIHKIRSHNIEVFDDSLRYWAVDETTGEGLMLTGEYNSSGYKQISDFLTARLEIDTFQNDIEFSADNLIND